MTDEECEHKDVAPIRDLFTGALEAVCVACGVVVATECRLQTLRLWAGIPICERHAVLIAKAVIRAGLL